MSDETNQIIRITDTYAGILSTMTQPQIAYATDTNAGANVVPGTPITRISSTFAVLAIQNFVDPSTGGVTHADNHFGACEFFDKIKYDSTDIPTISNDEDIVHKKHLDDTLSALSGVSGTGTINKLSKWSASDTITDSIVTDDGSTVTVAGDVTANDLNVNKVDYDGTEYQSSTPTYQAGRSFYNERGWLQVMSDDEDLLIEAGATLVSKFTNESGGPIVKGQALWATGLNTAGTNFAVDLGSSYEPEQNYLVGIAATDAADGEEVAFMQKGVITGMDTSSLTPGEAVFLGATPGSLTNTPPAYPSRHVAVGGAFNSHATDGILGVNILITDYKAEFEGTLVEKIALEVVVSGGEVYLMAEANGGGNFHTRYLGRYYEVNALTAVGSPDSSGRAYVQLTKGTATAPILSYIYVTVSGGNAVLAASTSRPSSNYAYVCELAIQTDTIVSSQGPKMLRRHTNCKVNGGNDDVGIIAAMAERLRLIGVQYVPNSGLDATLTKTTNIGSLDSVRLQTTTATIYQMWQQGAYPAVDSNTDDFYIANSTGGSLAKYDSVNNLAEAMAQLADGTSIPSGRRGNLVVFYCCNSSSGGASTHSFYVNLSLSYYSNDDDAYSDIENSADVSVPNELRATAFLAYRIPFRYRTNDSGTIDLIGDTLGKDVAISLRGNPIGLSGIGSTSAGQTVFADSTFRVYDDADDTKEVAFEVSGVTTGTTRTLTVPDKDGTIATLDDGGKVEVKDEGVSVSADARTLNFVGDGVTVTDAGSDEMTISVPGGVGRYYEYFESTGDSTDRSSSLQTVLNGMTNGGTVVFSSGDFYLESSVLIPSNIELIGEARNTRFLRNSTIDNLIRNDNTATGGYGGNENIVIRGIVFDANTSYNTDPCTPLALGHSNAIRIIDCEFVNVYSWHGIELNAVSNSIVENCIFHDFEGADEDEEMLQIDNMGTSGRWPWESGTTSYDGTPCINITVSKCTFHSGATALGTHSYTVDKSHDGIVISDCVFYDLTEYAIKTVMWNNVLITNCKFNNTAYSIVTQDNDMSGWNINNCTINSNTGRGIQLAYINRLNISNVALDSVTGHAIGFDNSTAVTVSNITITDCLEVGLYVYRSSDVAISNVSVVGGGGNQSSTEGDITVGSSTYNATYSTYDVVISNCRVSTIDIRSYTEKTIITNCVVISAITNVGGSNLQTNANFINGTYSNTFLDNNLSIVDQSDSSKEVKLQVSGVTAGTTRTVTVPDKSGTMAMTSDISAMIDGSGTANYLPKFSDSNTVANSILYDNGTNIGINNSSPSAKLDIAANTASAYGLLVTQSSTSGFGLKVITAGSGTNPSFFVQSNGANALKVLENGEIQMLQVYSDTVGSTNRDLFIDDTGKLGYVSSSERYKENVVDMRDTSWIYDLRPVDFEYKAEYGGYESQGLIAEEVELVRPELVSYNEVYEDVPVLDDNGNVQWDDGVLYVDEDGVPLVDGNWDAMYAEEPKPITKEVLVGREVETVNYSKLISPLLDQIQKLNARIEALEALNG